MIQRAAATKPHAKLPPINHDKSSPPRLLRQRGWMDATISAAAESKKSPHETSITTCLARRTRTSGTSRGLIRNRDSERERNQHPSLVARAGDSLPSSLLTLSAPTLSCTSLLFLPFPPQSALSATVSGDPQIPARTPTHTHRPGNAFASCEITLTTTHLDQTFVVILPLRHLPPAILLSCDRDAMTAATSLRHNPCTPAHSNLASAVHTDCIDMHELFMKLQE